MEPTNKAMKLLIAFSLGSITLNIMQFFGLFAKMNHWHLLLAALLLMGIDFATAMLKLRAKKIEPTSSGQRKTLSKFTQYGTSVAVAYVLFFLFKGQSANAILVLNLVLLAIIFVEITSIGENVYEANPTSYLARYFIYPLLYICKFGMIKNPLMKKMELLQQEEEKAKKQNNETATE